MSRHLLLPLPDVAALVGEISVGWDRPLQTFFAQVLSAKLDEDGNAADLLWIGAGIDEVRSARVAIDAVRAWAIIPDGLNAQLETERLASLTRRDTDYQAETKRRLLRPRF